MTRAAEVALCLALAACAARPDGLARAPVGLTPDGPASPSLAYVFDSLDGRPVTGAALRGKATVLTFFTTGDVASQAQANYLATMARHDGHRVNYVMVAMEPKTQRELVELYRGKLNLPFPVALADELTLRGEGPFGPLDVVPTTIVLDPGGAIRARKTGLVKPDEIRSALP